MEAIVLQPLLQVLLDKLTPLLTTTITSLVNVNKDVERLRDQLLLIQAVIHDAEARQVAEERVRYWLNKLHSIACDADDILDRLRTEDLRRQIPTKKKVSFLSHLRPNFDYIRISIGLKGIEKSIRDLASDIPILQLGNSGVDYRRYESDGRRQMGICVDESQVVGREDDVQILGEMLVSSSSSHSNNVSRSVIPVLPIVGMSGVGKTTLAQLVFNNLGIQNYFDLRIWITVGDDFNVRKIIRDILEYVEPKDVYASQLPQLGSLQSRLQELLRGKKYLLVLDDVSNVADAEWSKLREPLNCGADGSKIVITTQNQSIAARMGTHEPYALKPLALDDCWTLFQQIAFSDGRQQDYPILMDIGKDIVKKCGGIPLAAKVLGSILRWQRDEREWSNVLSSDIDGSILSVLRLTYNRLPATQKRCFAYCSVFPRNYEIKREKVIHQWIADGLIPSLREGIFSKKMEDLANEYFNELVQIFLFEAVSYSPDGKIIGFWVHDLIHDLALSISTSNYKKINEVEMRSFPAERRAYVACNALASPICELLQLGKLRTLHLLCPGNNLTESLPVLFTRATHLRVLTMSNCGITDIDKSIDNLIYLRYLDLSHNLMKKLPETVCHLINLQTLNLSDCRGLEELPRKMSNLIELRHLNIEDCFSLSRMPTGIGCLKKIQTLPIFVIGQNNGGILSELKHLGLQGELKIKHLENVESVDGEPWPSFLQYSQLHALSLSWGDNNEGKVRSNTPGQNVHQNHYLDILDSAVPRRHLRALQISGYSGAVFSQWMHELMLPNLKKLVLENCRRCVSLPTLGQFPFLEYLKMHGMDEVVNITYEFNSRHGPNKSFAFLKELIIQDFIQLQSWESMESMEAFPLLQKLSIIKCPRLTSMPRFPSLKHLHLNECHDLLLREASKLNSLAILVVDVCQEASFIPKLLLSRNPLLTSLKISSCPRLQSLPISIGSLTTLKSLSIKFCEALEILPREMLGLTNLETLEIVQCPILSLSSECMQGLKSLRSLSIENCDNLNSLPPTLRNLSALEHLTIMYCPNLEYLPDIVEEFKALRSINIVHCSALKTLPSGLQRVSSLQSLEIRGCPELQQLPGWIGNLLSLRSLAISDCENIKVFPDEIRRLKDLQHLSIIDCPDLESRCQEETGVDWPKISHIPFKYVGCAASSQGNAPAPTSTSAP